jgi:RNA polymerase sigma-70 factor (ECF subfamily)
LEHNDDRNLVRRVQRGDDTAFRDLVDRYEGRLLVLARRLIGDAQRAEDIVQDAFLKAYSKIGGFGFGSTFYTWIYRITVNTASDLRKSEARRRTASLDDDRLGSSLSGPNPGPEHAVSARERQQIVRREIDRLSPKLSTILRLRELEGLTYEEIAGVLGVAKGTVESRLFRAREKLRERLKEVL